VHNSGGQKINEKRMLGLCPKRGFGKEKRRRKLANLVSGQEGEGGSRAEWTMKGDEVGRLLGYAAKNRQSGKKVIKYVEGSGGKVLTIKE